jgi:hypothetical protein
MRDPSISAAMQRGVATTLVTGGATSYGPGALAIGGGGQGWPPPPGVPDRCSPRGGEPASPPPSTTAHSEHLLVQDPEGSRQWRSLGRRGSRRPVAEPQCTGGVRLWESTGREPSPCSGCRGRPRSFTPELADLTVTEEAEGSIARGGICGGSGQSVEGIEEAAFKRHGWRRSIKSQCRNRSIGAAPVGGMTPGRVKRLERYKECG